MGIFSRKPRVRALARAGNVDGLVAASRYSDPVTGTNGRMIDQGTPTRIEALYALRDLGPEYGHEAVVESLTDPEDRVRAAAVVVLFERQDVASIAESLRWLPRQDSSRWLAFRALSELGSPDAPLNAANALVRQLPDEPLAEEDMAAFDQVVGGRDQNGALFDLLAEALRDENEYVGDRAAQLLMRMAPASVEVLIGCLPDQAAGRRAALALGQIKDIRALEPLIETLDHPDPRARAASCAALGELRDPSAVEPLLRASQDPEFAVRAGAGSALNVLGTVAVVVGVSTLLRPEFSNTLEANSVPPREVEAGPDDRRARAERPQPTTLERVAVLLEGLGTAGQSGVY